VRKDEITIAIALVVAGLFTMGVVIPRYVVGDTVGEGLSPAFMPYVATGLATLSALGMLLEGLRRSHPSGASARITRTNMAFLGACALVLGASYTLMSVLGYVAGGIALVGGLLALARVSPMTLAMTAVTAPVALWLVFVGLLATPLP
jgi:hypothetical protein